MSQATADRTHDGKVYDEDALFKELGDYIRALPQRNGALITVLHKAQELFGYLPENVQNFVANKLEIPTSKVFGVVSFYSHFATKPKGACQINVCMGTACFVREADRVLEAIKNELGVEVGETSKDGAYSLDSVRCVGACGLAPVVSINGRVCGRIRAGDVEDLLKDICGSGKGAPES